MGRQAGSRGPHRYIATSSEEHDGTEVHLWALRGSGALQSQDVWMLLHCYGAQLKCSMVGRLSRRTAATSQPSAARIVCARTSWLAIDGSCCSSVRSIQPLRLCLPHLMWAAAVLACARSCQLSQRQYRATDAH